MELSKDEIKKAINEAKLNKAKTKLDELVKELEKDGVSVQAKMLYLPQGVIPQIILNIIDDTGNNPGNPNLTPNPDNSNIPRQEAVQPPQTGKKDKK